MLDNGPSRIETGAFILKKISGKVSSWKICGVVRRFVTVAVTPCFGERHRIIIIGEQNLNMDTSTVEANDSSNKHQE